MTEHIAAEEIKKEDAGKKVKMIKTNGSDIEEIFVDGIAGVLSRNGVFKLDCYRVVTLDSEEDAEVRRVSHRLVIPAGSMGELIQAVQGIVQKNAKASEKIEKTN
jgi:hypothetical protein